MPWLRIDDRVRTHPKIVEAGPGASWFWFCGICYCREHLTDGFIPKGMLASLCPGVAIGAARKLAKSLIDNNLWHEAKGGYQVHDFLDWNPSRASVLAKRKEESDRKNRERNGPGVRTDSGEVSDTDNLRTNDGQIQDTPTSVQPDTSRASAIGGGRDPAIAHGSGLGSGSGSSSLEGGPGETAPHHGRAGSLIAPPIDWWRKHGAVHVAEFCDWVCFPNDLHLEFAQKVTGIPVEQAQAQVLAWARDIRRQWHGRIVPDGSPWEFWKHRWTETHGGSKPVTGPTGDGLDGLRAAVRNG